MAMSPLDDDEKDVLRYLAQRFHNGEKRAELEQYPRTAELGWDRVLEIARRFRNYGWLHEREQDTGIMWMRWFDLDGQLVEAVDELDNPPPKDYWKGIAVWFKSKPWSIPVFLVLVATPLVATWFDLIAKLLRWVGVME